MMANWNGDYALRDKIGAAAGDLLVKHFGTAATYEKSSNNLVTQADLESEALVKERLADAFPHEGVVCEEGDDTGALCDPNVWIVDPLDATNNYAHGVPHFSVSIAHAARWNCRRWCRLRSGPKRAL